MTIERLIECIDSNEKVNKECYVEVCHDVPLIKFNCLREYEDWMTLAFSTRLGGVSEGNLESMNLGWDRGDTRENVCENYRRVCGAIEGDYTKLVLSDQVHDSIVEQVDEKYVAGENIEKKLKGVDGMITDEAGLILATSYADCVPLFLVDPVHRAIGSAHSGWRGTVAQIGTKAIEKMQKCFGTKPEDMICIVGPSICQDCYEVSVDVIDEFKKVYPENIWDKLFYAKINDSCDEKYQLNLWYANYYQFIKAGVRPDNIHVSSLCTCCNSDVLFSHRASHGKRGNLNGFMMIR